MSLQQSELAWRPCEPGQIECMVRRIHTRRRAVFAGQLAGGLVVGMLLGLAFLGLRELNTRTHDEQYHYGGIACSEVLRNVEPYMEGQLDPSLRQRIDLHLSQCPHCGSIVRRMMPSQRQTDTGARSPANLSLAFSVTRSSFSRR